MYCEYKDINLNSKSQGSEFCFKFIFALLVQGGF